MVRKKKWRGFSYVIPTLERELKGIEEKPPRIWDKRGKFLLFFMSADKSAIFKLSHSSMAEANQIAVAILFIYLFIYLFIRHLFVG